MLRRTPTAHRYFGWNYFGPLVRIPDEFSMRVANVKQHVTTDKRDPKNKWGLANVERMSMHPSLWGDDRWNYGHSQANHGGLICEIPPVPCYREHIWCHGHFQVKGGKNIHPRIFIKAPRGKIVMCKWCRLKYINMSSDDDSDEDWQKEMYKIETTPETMKQLMTPRRNMDGVLYPSSFHEPPHPEVYKTVFNPEVYYAKYGYKKPGLSNAENEDKPGPEEVQKMIAEREAKQMALESGEEEREPELVPASTPKKHTEEKQMQA